MRKLSLIKPGSWPRMTPLERKALFVFLDMLRPFRPGAPVPSERRIAAAAGVSRTVVRGVMRTLEEQGVIHREGRSLLLRRMVNKRDYPGKVVEPLPRRQKVREFLLKKFARAGFRPGDRVSELGLANALGVATICVREALLELLPLGILTKKERQQWEVADLTLDQIRDLREFREMTELWCLRKLMRSGRGIEERKVFSEIRSATRQWLLEERPRISHMLKVDIAFHRRLLESAGNPLVASRAGFIYLIIEFQLVNPLFTVERGRLGLRQHIGILDAIIADDLPKAERRLLVHLREAENTLCAIAGRTIR